MELVEESIIDTLEESMIDKGIGKRIRKLREEQGMTREELAVKAEITTKFLYEIENGKKGMSANNLNKIATALDSCCDYILLGRNRENAESKVERLYSELLKGMTTEQREIVIKILELLLEYSEGIKEHEL